MKDNTRNMLQSILVGAIVAFISTALQGLLDWLNANASTLLGVVAGGFRQYYRWRV